MKQFEIKKQALERKWNGIDFMDIDIMYFIDGFKKTTTCYSPFLIKKRGWCYIENLISYPSYPFPIRAWGVCSLSCSAQLKSVSIQFITTILHYFIKIIILRILKFASRCRWMYNCLSFIHLSDIKQFSFLHFPLHWLQLVFDIKYSFLFFNVCMSDQMKYIF